VTKLLAVLALDLGVVPRLGALPGDVALLFTVAARNVGGVLGLVALLGHVVLGATVVARALDGIRALMLVSGMLLMWDVANTYILREMAGLVALSAFNALRWPRFRALFRIVTLLFAVLASMRIETLFGTIACTMTGLLAIYALDDGLVGLVLHSLLRAALEKTSVTAW
jgi:hypothetical protein